MRVSLGGLCWKCNWSGWDRRRSWRLRRQGLLACTWRITLDRGRASEGRRRCGQSSRLPNLYIKLVVFNFRLRDIRTMNPMDIPIFNFGIWNLKLKSENSLSGQHYKHENKHFFFTHENLSDLDDPRLLDTILGESYASWCFLSFLSTSSLKDCEKSRHSLSMDS